MNNEPKLSPTQKVKDVLGQVGKAFVPKRFRADLRAYLAKAGIQEVPYTFFGVLFYVAIIADTKLI